MAGRAKVLSIYKILHRTGQRVFKGDEAALSYVRVKIAEEFKKFQTEKNPAEINSLIKVATETEELLRNKVIQAEEVRPNVYQLRSDDLRQKCTNARESCGRPDCTCV